MSTNVRFTPHADSRPSSSLGMTSQSYLWLDQHDNIQVIVDDLTVDYLDRLAVEALALSAKIRAAREQVA